MYELTIASRYESYKVAIGANIDDVVSDFDVIVADTSIRDHLTSPANAYWVDSAEHVKNLGEVERLCEFMRSVGANRASKVLAVGGGVIQDLVTLSASIYMRGIPWSYAPTTLTGMADSCLGGKSSINVGSTKNLVGNVYPPESVTIDTKFLTTLEAEGLAAGLAEGVKIAFARGPQQFQDFISNPAALQPGNDLATRNLIFHTLNCKKWFIEVDEFDKAERQLLNFGHSFGHAFEAASNFGIQHGIGVAIGMIAAAEHPDSHKSTDTEELVAYSTQLLAPHRERIRNAVAETDWDIFEKSLTSDKKNTRDDLVLILPSAGQPLIKKFLPFSAGAVATARITLETVLENLI
jgi:3-dehydroquinate synthase